MIVKYISQSCICSTHFHTCRIPWLLPSPNFKLMNFYSFQTWMNGPCSQETSIFLGESWWHQLVNPLNTEPHQGTHRLQPAAMIRPKERDVEKSLAECWLWVGESFLGSSSPTSPMFLYSDAFYMMCPSRETAEIDIFGPPAIRSVQICG